MAIGMRLEFTLTNTAQKMSHLKELIKIGFKALDIIYIIIEINFLDEENSNSEDLVQLLTSKNIEPFTTKIFLGCKTTEFVFVIDNISKHFKALNPTNIEKSRSFWTKPQTNKEPTLITVDNFYKTRSKSNIFKYAGEKKDKRLDLRAHRNYLELVRSKNGENLNDLLYSFENKMSQIEYLYGQIYLCLIRGGTLLMSDLELAIKEFHIVQELCKDNTIELELAHSFFGLGEAYRIKGEYEFSLKYYTQALDIYKFKEVKWGILRISLALKELKNVPQKFSKATFNINLSVDHWIENNRIKMLTIKSDILFINIP